MGDPDTRPEQVIALLVPHPTLPGTVLTTADPIALPTASYAADVDHHTEAALAAAMARLGGVLPPVLRLTPTSWTPTGDPARLIAALETIGDLAPADLVWTELDEATIDALRPTEIVAPVRRWLARRLNGPLPGDPPWTRPGWQVACRAWMTTQMAALGTPALEPPRIHYHWGLSMVLRAPTVDGQMFLKCSAPIFGNEAAVTQRLAQATPDLVTRVAAIEPTEGWLLMDDLGGAPLGDAPQARWATGLEAHAGIQRAWSGRTEDLLAAGAPDRSITGLADAIPLFETRAPLSTTLIGDDLAAWRAAVPGFVAACRRLDALGPPPTLIHGDLHPWNVADTPAGPRIFDWTDASVSHPFTDLAVYATRPADPVVRRSLRDAYLACWSDVLDPARLAEAGDLAFVVGTLHQVDSYLRIAESVGPDDIWDMADAARSWALSAVGVLREGIDIRRPGHADG